MSKEILMLVDALSNVKGLSKEVVFKAAEEGIKEALMATMHRKLGTDIQLNVVINRETGDYEITQVWKIVEEDALTNPDQEIILSEAQKKRTNSEVGEEIQ